MVGPRVLYKLAPPLLLIMEKEKFGRDSNLTLRFHHLHNIWRDAIKKYLNYSQNKKPWEVPTENFSDISNFVEQFSKDDLKGDLILKRFFEESVIDNPDATDDYSYVIDLIGFNEIDHQKVLVGRTAHIMKIFEVAMSDKHTRIYLSRDPDDYCKSCAIGKHCYENASDDENTDLKYKGALDQIFKDERMRRLIKKGDMGINEKGEFYITANLLFNPNFYLFLELIVKQRDNLGNDKISL